MNSLKKSFISILGYFLSGSLALILGLFVAKGLLPEGQAQTPPPPPAAAQPAASNPPPATAPTITDDLSPASRDLLLQNQNEKPKAQEQQPDKVDLFLEPYVYDPKGRRDPFEPFTGVAVDVGGTGRPQGPVLPLERFDLDQIKLVGIIWSVDDPKAMFKDPTSKIHILGKDQRIGRNQGYIAVIREGEVVIVEASRDNDGDIKYDTKVLRIKR